MKQIVYLYRYTIALWLESIFVELISLLHLELEAEGSWLLLEDVQDLVPWHIVLVVAKDARLGDDRLNLMYCHAA